MPGRPSHASRPRLRALALTGGLVALSGVLTGCSEEAKRGFLPRGVTENSPKVVELWNGVWIAGLAVGVLVWGLTAYVMVRYRQRPGDTRRPAQTRYNVPLEILYTVVPVLMVAALFAQTLRTEQALTDTSAEPDVVVNVVGKQWSWDFNYVKEDVHHAGVQVDLSSGEPGQLEKAPILYLPVNKRVEFVLTSRDVIHSFWVINFVQKLDVVPGKINSFQVVAKEEGTFQGKCAELCGAYHGEMLFQVKVVSQEEYDKQIKAMRDRGDTGLLDTGLNREQFVEGESAEKLKKYPQLMPSEDAQEASK